MSHRRATRATARAAATNPTPVGADSGQAETPAPLKVGGAKNITGKQAAKRATEHAIQPAAVAASAPASHPMAATPGDPPLGPTSDSQKEHLGSIPTHLIPATVGSDPKERPSPANASDSQHSDPPLDPTSKSQSNVLRGISSPSIPAKAGSAPKVVPPADAGRDSLGNLALNTVQGKINTIDSSTAPPLRLRLPASAPTTAAPGPSPEQDPTSVQNAHLDSPSEDSDADGNYSPPQLGTRNPESDDENEEEEVEWHLLSEDEGSAAKKGKKASASTKRAPTARSPSVATMPKKRGAKAKNTKKKGSKAATVTDTLVISPYVAVNGDSPGDDDDDEGVDKRELMVPDKATFTMIRNESGGQVTPFGAEHPASSYDWAQLQQCWDARSGAPSDEAIQQIRDLTSQFTYHLYDIAAKSGLSQARAWQATGMLRREARKVNVWNLWSAKEAEVIRAENGGNSLQGGSRATNQILSERWEAIPPAQKKEIKAQLIKEAEIDARRTAKEELATADARKKYVGEFCKNMTDQMSAEMNRTGLVSVGFAIMAQDSAKELPPVSMFYATHDVGVGLWSKYAPHLNAMQQYLMSKLSGLEPVETNGWPTYRNNYIQVIKNMNRDELRTEIAHHLRIMEVLTAPWEEDAREAEPMMLGGRFHWKDSTRRCRNQGAVLVGWPVGKIWPGVASMKVLDVEEMLTIAMKLNNDRKPGKSGKSARMIEFQLRYMTVDELWFKNTNKGPCIYDSAVEDSKPLADLPYKDRPTVVSEEGKILACISDDESDMEKERRETRERAKLALQSDDENDGSEAEAPKSSDEGNESEGSNVDTTALVEMNKGNKKRQRDEVEEEEEENMRKRQKGKGKARSKA